MFVVTSLATKAGDKEYKFTFNGTRVLRESPNGDKELNQWHSASLRLIIDKTQGVAVEVILMPDVNGAWYRFPIGTFDKILENVYDFKPEGDLLNF
jgi:hypothetical protein